MDLPNKEKTFACEHIGETTGKKYDGQFTVRCILNVGQKHALALEKTRLLGSYESPTDDLAGLAIILANLRARIVDAPEWWKQSNGGSLVDDEDVLVVLYRKIQEAELEWKEDLKKKTQKIPDPTSQSSTP
jgi:hypothetical protein